MSILSQISASPLFVEKLIREWKLCSYRVLDCLANQIVVYENILAHPPQAEAIPADRNIYKIELREERRREYCCISGGEAHKSSDLI